jgi:hypothetical protein
MQRSAVYRHLLTLVMLATGCVSEQYDAFTQERDQLFCEIDVACGEQVSVPCDQLEGWGDKDRCQRYHASKADQCLAELEDRLAEVEQDAAACDDDFVSKSCADAVEWKSSRRGCDAIAGRPLTHEGEWILAEVAHGERWSERALDLPAIDPASRRRAALQWLEIARIEHASVASFSRASLELMAVAAPPHLLEGCHLAALDEIRHARLALDMARALGVTSWDLGALPTVPSRAVSLRQVAIDALLEGCIGEGGAAACAHVAAGRSTGIVAEVVRTIADDETRHATLAWATLRWALERDRSLAGPLTRALEQARAERRERATQLQPEGRSTEGFGLLGAAQTAQIEAEVIDEVVAPALAMLIARSCGAPAEAALS